MPRPLVLLLRLALAVVVALPSVAGASPLAGAQGESPPTTSAPLAGSPLAGPALFLPLVAAFEPCLPLDRPCPEGSSSMVVVPASGRRVAWTPEATSLPEETLAVPAVAALGTPPPNPGGARYLLPVVDGAGPGLVFVPRRLSEGRLVAPGEGDQGPAAVPVLAGPLLGGEPRGEVVDALFEEPSAVDASELADQVPALLVRRAAPSRVAFGVRPDPEWGLDSDYVGLLDEGLVAVLARHDGRVGLAVPAAAVSDEPLAPAGAGERGAGDEDHDGHEGGGFPILPLGLAAGLALAAVVAAVARRR